jgi:hypothetical protein
VQNTADLSSIHTGLEKVFAVSAYLDFPFTLDEIASYFLPRLNITAQELRHLLAGGKFADIPFQIQDGYLLTRPNQSWVSRLDRERMSAAKLHSAAEFARMLTRLVPFIRTVAVTGSVAYGSAGKWDDIDLFLVTDSNRLWLSAFMTLVLVRLCKFLKLRQSHLLLFCLSYVHDKQGFAKESLRNQTNPLFARELLKAKPVAGVHQYREILQENDWVGKIYVAPYITKMRGLEQDCNGRIHERLGSSSRVSFVLGWAEGVMFIILSRYLRLRAYLTNLKLKSQRQDLRVFAPILTPASCVYTSNFYRWLRGLWGQ